MNLLQSLLPIITCLMHGMACTRESSNKLACLDVSIHQLEQVKLECIRQMQVGLKGEAGGLPMFPSYITHFPSQHEQGTFLSADLGGTYFRVAIVSLEEEDYKFIKRFSIPIPEQIKTGLSHEKLFDFMAEELVQFVLKYCPQSKEIKLAFTFSYPFLQKRLDKGIITSWSKGIDLPSAIGLDVVELYQHSLDKRTGSDGKTRIKIVALMNDTVAQVLAYKRINKNILLSCIFGTGTNGGLVVTVDKETFGPVQWDSFGSMKDKQTIINTEWGSFFNPTLLPITEYDERVDRKSNNPGKQRFEKLISGFYISEIVKEILKSDFSDIYSKYSSVITNEFISLIANEEHLSPSQMPTIMDHLSKESFTTEPRNGKNNPTIKDMLIIQQISQSVLRRCARLSAVLIVSGLEVTKRKREEYVVSFDGALYQNSPIFQRVLHQTVQELLNGFMPTVVYRSDLHCTLLGGAVLLASPDEKDSPIDESTFINKNEFSC